MIKKVFFVLLALLLLSVPAIVKMVHDQTNKYNYLPFKCLTYTRYVLDDDGRKIRMDITQDLRLYTSENAYFLLNGTVQDEGIISRLSRTVRLKNGSLIQGKTFIYEIIGIEKMDGDTSDDRIFQRLLNEFRTGNREFQIDVFRIDKLTWLVGGPHAFINTCTRY